MAKVTVLVYGRCELVERETVLNDLQYQYEGTVYGSGRLYDVYSDEDGNYVCVPEDE